MKVALLPFFNFIEKQKGANRSLQRTAMITASHAYLVTRSKNIKKMACFQWQPRTSPEEER